jgi:hypothetical protein
MDMRKSRERQKIIPLALFFGAAILLVVAGVAWFQMNDGPVAGKIGPRLALDAERIDFGKQPYNKQVHAEFKITNTGDRAMTLDATTPVRVVEGC